MVARFWGTRGSIASPGAGTVRFGGNTSCVEVSTPSGGVLVLDCGTGARALGNWLLAQSTGAIKATILFSHTHWDHIQGFPFFAPLFQPNNHFDVYGPEGAHLSLRDVLRGQMEAHYFPVELDQLAARITYRDLSEGVHEIDGVKVHALKMNHPSPTLGYRIEAQDKSICYLCDHEPFAEYALQSDLGRLAAALAPGDLRHAEFMQDADVVIHEAQYTPEEYPSKRNWGHSTYAYAVELAAAFGVRRLYLTHHDPAHNDEFLVELENRAQDLASSLGSNLQVSCAYEGCEIAI